MWSIAHDTLPTGCSRLRANKRTAHALAGVDDHRVVDDLHAKLVEVAWRGAAHVLRIAPVSRAVAWADEQLIGWDIRHQAAQWTHTW